MLHRRNLRYGQGWRVGNRSYEARKRHENHGDCGSPWIAALGQHARGEPSRSASGAAMFRLLHDRSQAGKLDRRSLSRYMRRWLVERFFAWIQWQRRILIRWEYHAHNFLGFVQLACLVILFKRF